jgi:hypothetical protein
MVSFVGLNVGTAPFDAGIVMIGVAMRKELADDELGGQAVAEAAVEGAAVDNADLAVF